MQLTSAACSRVALAGTIRCSSLLHIINCINSSKHFDRLQHSLKHVRKHECKRAAYGADDAVRDKQAVDILLDRF